MNEILLDTSASVEKVTAEFDATTSDSFIEERQPMSYQCSSVPLFFHSLGGHWEGEIQCVTSSALELHLQGMPPVLVGQKITFQYFGNSSAMMNSTQMGKIQHVTIHRGSTVWEGRSILRVELDHSQKTLKTLGKSNTDSFILEPGSFVMGQVSENESSSSGELDLSIEENLPIQDSQAKALDNLRHQGFKGNPHIKSDRVVLENLEGHTIMAYHDYPISTDLSSLPIVVIAPGYGETKRDYLTVAYFFACNGFHVIRYDHTNHVGESHGEHFHFTLSSMKQDFQAVTRFVNQQWPQSPVIGVASSLAAPVTLKVEAEECSLALLILLVGVVDVERTIAEVHQEDLFANYRKGHIPYSTNILGFNVNGHFLTDAATNNFSTLARTVKDAQALQTPLFYVSAGKDAWIDRQDVEIFKQAVSSRLSMWLDVPEALHRIQENPKVARSIYRQIIEHCRNHIADVSQEVKIHEPNRLILGRQNRYEKITLQAHSHTDVGQGFWDDYLGHFQTIGKCQDYVQLLDHVFHTLGPVTPGQQMLDAGCGNGNAGRFLLQSLKHPTITTNHSIRYVGIDACSEALGRAQAHMTQAYHSRQKGQDSDQSSIQMAWLQVDLQHRLPFRDHQFDRIVSNLVLGYVIDPEASLRELYRVLAPGGRMVISNLKPNGDFSEIYQNLVTQADGQDQKSEARELLNNYGKIRQAEKEGQFRFFDQTEWRKALDSLQCVHVGVYPTFANQAYLIVLEKPVAPGKIPTIPFQDFDRSNPPFNGICNTFNNAA